MRRFDDHLREEYVFLADVTHNQALIAWGAFFFDTSGKLIPDRKLRELAGHAGRLTSIGADSQSYGVAIVQVRGEQGDVVTVTNDGRNFAWIKGLQSDAKYTYKVTVGGVTWGEGELFDYDPDGETLARTGETYANTFRTCPAPATRANLTFAVIGDVGTGNAVQGDVARALARTVEERDVRLIVVAGDVIYKKSGGSGDDDDEWLMTYFQPYRRIINAVPVYPLMGNHDTNETIFGENQADRHEVYDNFFVLERFRGVPMRDSSIEPGLFYRFQYGSAVEFIMIDTSHKSGFLFFPGERMFDHKSHKAYLDKVFAVPLEEPAWRIPVTHHPPYCIGPKHGDSNSVIEDVVLGRCIPAGVKALFSGHEHNFQCFKSSDPNRAITTFVTGGGGSFRDDPPDGHSKGELVCWGGNAAGHFLLAAIDGDTMTVSVIGQDGAPLPLVGPGGGPFAGALVVR